jgi:phosphate transport system permease protein
MLRYGATRWDQAERLLDRFFWVEEWVEDKPGEGLPNAEVRVGDPEPLVVHRKPRADLFPEPLQPLFAYVEENADKMMRPRFTVYWQFFIDDNFNSHYFGGVGPEILGTLFITIVGMLFVIPLGIISAAYLVECSADGQVIRIIRMCINTLAGVPSIVFGLFGLAFFVLFLFPLLGFEPKPCILAASMTLAVLTLPVMIRASEEAIRAVPRAYKEGALALGASRFRTFLSVTLPAALPGILTGVILSLSRIAGETAPILFTGAVAMGDTPRSVFDPTRTLSYGSYDMAVGDRLAMMVPHNQYGMVVTLVLLILILNAAAIVLRTHVFKRLRGQ